MRLILDGTNQLYRGYYAVKGGLSHKGFPTNAILGFHRMLFSYVRRFKPDEVLIVFDSKGTNFRHEIWPEYKGTRNKDPEVQASLRKQLPVIMQLAAYCGFAIVCKNGKEADDIIGSAANCKSLITSGDKDFAQLVSKKVRLFNPNKDVIITPKNCKEYFGVEANRVIDYLTLDGDSIDNIPGVPGVGPATAIKLIEEFDDLLDIPLEKFPKKSRDAATYEIIKRNRELVTIRRDVYDVSQVDMRIGPVQLEKALKLCRRYGLQSLENSIHNLGSISNG